MKRKKLIILNDICRGGGVENVMITIITYLLQRQYEVTVATADRTGIELPEYIRKSIHYKLIHYTRKQCKKYSIKRIFNKIYCLVLNSKLLFCKYDVALAIKEGPPMIWARKYIRAEKKIGWVHVNYEHMHWTKEIFSTNAAERKLLSKFNHIVCVSQETKRSLMSTIGDSNNLVVKYNPIDVDRICSLSKLTLNCDYQKNKDRVTFVSVGRLSEVKSYDRLLRICKRLNETYKFDLWIIGGGPERDKLYDYKEDNSLANVIFLGSMENPYPILRMADWYISSARTESFGLSVQEALILKVPVILAEFPAIYELAAESEVIITKNNENALYEGMERILQTPGLKEEYQNAIQPRYQSSLYDKRLQEIEDLWLNEL